MVSNVVVETEPKGMAPLAEPTRAFESEAEQIAYLQARVGLLEEELARRSRIIIQTERLLCRRDQVIVARANAGLAPLPPYAFDPTWWRETIELLPAEVEPILDDLWLSLFPLPEIEPGPDRLA
jgi:hypothetical protein